ncbi:MAG TPA: ABC transporter substrate-binding protein [Methanomicrobiales archaeon]|jgi:branched-chain amino acid transport system substrate-binding protein|nr:ABC transporter substrate-binding protein [Methanomicrobiales archaeon]
MKQGTMVSVLLLMVVLASVLLAGCAQQQQASPQDIKLGAVVSLTGSGSSVGKHMKQSAELAVSEINAQGGVFVKAYNKKLPITLIVADDETKPDSAVKAVTKLISEDNVDVLVGGWSSGVTLASLGVVAEKKVPYVVTGASSPDVTRKTDVDKSYVFHYCPTTAMYGQYTTLFMDQVIRPAINEKFEFNDSRPLRVALLYQDSAYGKGVLNGVISTITSNNLNIQIVSNQSFKMGEADFRTALTAIKAAKPDVIYPAALPAEQTQIVVQARRDVNINTIILAVETNDNPDYYKGIGRFGEYSIIESRFSPYATPQTAIAAADLKFKSDYQAKYGTLPDMMGTSTYEGVYIAAKAMENAGTLDKAAVKDALASLAMPEIVEVIQDRTISFSKDYHEVQFALFMEQLIWDAQAGEVRPKIVWPDNLKVSDFVLPDWYQPGSG